MARNASGEQLPARHHTVLSRSKTRDYLVGESTVRLSRDMRFNPAQTTGAPDD